VPGTHRARGPARRAASGEPAGCRRSPAIAQDAPLDDRAWRYLADHRVAHLATRDAAGRPYVVPLCYASDGGAIYSALDQKPKRVDAVALKRVRNLLAQPEVALLVDDYSEDWSRLAYLLVRGRAELLHPGGPDHAAAVARLRAKYAQYRAMPIETQPIICIRPRRWSFWQSAP
jgi:coenzyme F420-0:L-glutamate ligase/coenzyme F420-1:gamma-L-glutamate ligase